MSAGLQVRGALHTLLLLAWLCMPGTFAAEGGTCGSKASRDLLASDDPRCAFELTREMVSAMTTKPAESEHLLNAILCGKTYEKLTASVFQLMMANILTWHFSMVNDAHRNGAYDNAIRAAVARATRKLGRPPVVLDIGAGTGLLGLMAARAGAKHVYSVEANRPLAQVATYVVAMNGHADRVTIIAKMSTELVVGVDLPAKADLLVSEIVDSAILGENMMPTYAHALAQLCTRQVIVLPERASLTGRLVESGTLRQRFQFDPFDAHHPSMAQGGDEGRGSGSGGLDDDNDHDDDYEAEEDEEKKEEEEAVVPIDLSVLASATNPDYELGERLMEGARVLSDEFELARYEFDVPLTASRSRTVAVPVTESGTADALVFNMQFHVDGNNSITIPLHSTMHFTWGFRPLPNRLSLSADMDRAAMLLVGESPTNIWWHLGERRPDVDPAAHPQLLGDPLDLYQSRPIKYFFQVLTRTNHRAPPAEFRSILGGLHASGSKQLFSPVFPLKAVPPSLLVPRAPQGADLHRLNSGEALPKALRWAVRPPTPSETKQHQSDNQ